jgi:hypothetical protein
MQLDSRDARSQGLDCVAEGHDARRGCLPTYLNISAQRSVWTLSADAKICSIDHQQYCRRRSATNHQRFYRLSSCRQRVISRTGNTNSPRATTWPHRGRPRLDKSDRRDGQIGQRSRARPETKDRRRNAVPVIGHRPLSAVRCPLDGATLSPRPIAWYFTPNLFTKPGSYKLRPSKITG